MSFVQHISTVAAGAKRVAATLGRLMPNVGGPSKSKRSLLMSVVHSGLLYGAPIWVDGAQVVQKSRNLLLQAHRSAALRVARYYRDVSDMAALVLAKMPPAHFLIAGRSRVAASRRADAVYTKQDLLAETIRQWQVVWNSTPKAAQSRLASTWPKC